MPATDHTRQPRRDLSNIVGQTFGMLTIVKFAGRCEKTGRRLWRCRCECGREIVKEVSKILAKNNTVKSCGCRKGNFKHLGSKSKIYNIYNHIKRRCISPTNRHYRHYGGRGITICEEWLASFEAFRDWALANGYRDGLSIERIDVNGNYCPANCTFIPRSDQPKNRRTSLFLEAFGERKYLTEWSRDPRCSVSVNALGTRIKRGWSAEEAISLPVDISRPRKHARMIEAFGEVKLMGEWLRDPRCRTNRNSLRFRLANGWEPERAITMPTEVYRHR